MTVRITYSATDRLFYIYLFDQAEQVAQLGYQRTKPTRARIDQLLARWMRKNVKVEQSKPKSSSWPSWL